MAKILNVSKVTSKYSLPDATIRTNEIDSNQAVIENMTTSFVKDKFSTRDYAAPKEEVQISLWLSNESDYEISNINIVDTKTDGATIKAGSVEIDNTAYPSFDPLAGFVLPNAIGKKKTVNVTYVVVVDNNPSVEQVEFESTVNYTVANTKNFEEKSNKASFKIAKGGIIVRKSADKYVVVKGQTITFENIIRNESNYTHTDVEFVDVLPDKTTFVANSVKIDGIAKPDADPTIGISLEDLAPDDHISIKFDVLVN